MGVSELCKGKKMTEEESIFLSSLFLRHLVNRYYLLPDAVSLLLQSTHQKGLDFINESYVNRLKINVPQFGNLHSTNESWVKLLVYILLLSK